MEHGFEKLHPDSKQERVPLYAGIDLTYFDIISESSSLRHEALGHIIQINYCRAGQVVWKTENGSNVFLNPGDFSVHTLDVCTDSTFEFPTGQYHGLTISIDLREAAVHPPELLAEADLFDGQLQMKFCQNGAISFLTGNAQTEHIFSAFFDRQERLRLPYQRVKVLELLLYLSEMELAPQNRLMGYRAEQIQVIREIHDHLLRHMEQRITIEDLSKQYLIDKTTLKSAFKAVYGTSLAAHIKKHRMEQAANMLRETDMSIAEIAAKVGYESQSKFTTAFKDILQMLPSTYRKQNQNTAPMSPNNMTG